MGKFCFLPTSIQGLVVVEPTIHRDNRGYFMETWNRLDFEEAGIHAEFVQDNQSLSRKGVLRGLHFQRQNPQGKLVRVISGRVWDVAVDIRRDSESFGQWFGVELSAENNRQFYISEGFAHGFLVLSESAEFVYKCTRFYEAQDEDGIRWDDPDLAIDWPLRRLQPIVSEKDAHLQSWRKVMWV